MISIWVSLPLYRKLRPTCVNEGPFSISCHISHSFNLCLRRLIFYFFDMSVIAGIRQIQLGLVSNVEVVLGDCYIFCGH